jgi:hypothetical protein
MTSLKWHQHEYNQPKRPLVFPRPTGSDATMVAGARNRAGSRLAATALQAMATRVPASDFQEYQFQSTKWRPLKASPAACPRL